MISLKRQIVLAALVFALGAAVYLNWQFENAEKDSLVDATTSTGTSSKMTLGEALYVGGGADSIVSGTDDITYVSATAEEYFSQARLSRQKTRDEAIEVMQTTIETATDNDQKLDISNSIIEIAKNIENEGKIENLVRAKGFDDCMAYVSEDSVQVIVAAPTGGLTPAQVAQIKDIVISEANVTAEAIKIVEIK